MQVQLTDEQVRTLLEESSSFRDIAVGLIKTASSLVGADIIRQRVIAIVRDYPSNKIAAIKAVRQFAHDNANAPLIAASFPEIRMDVAKADTLGLADSKKLVESIL